MSALTRKKGLMAIWFIYERFPCRFLDNMYTPESLFIFPFHLSRSSVHWHRRIADRLGIIATIPSYFKTKSFYFPSSYSLRLLKVPLLLFVFFSSCPRRNTTTCKASDPAVRIRQAMSQLQHHRPTYHHDVDARKTLSRWLTRIFRIHVRFTGT